MKFLAENVSPAISFISLTPDDLPVLHHWLQQPHVREFWDDGDRTLNQVLTHYDRKNNVQRYFFTINQEPSGYIQSYPINSQHAYAHVALPQKTTIGMDYFIGNLSHLGRGFAHHVLGQFIRKNASNVDRIVVDPDVNNAKAIHIYKCCGFEKIVAVEFNLKKRDLLAIDLRQTAHAVNCSHLNLMSSLQWRLSLDYLYS